MCTAPSVLMGPSLTNFIASNFALLQPTLVPIQGGTFMMGAGTDYGAHQATVSSFQMGRTPVTNEQYQRYLAVLGDRRHAQLGRDPVTKAWEVIALSASEKELTAAIKSVASRAAWGIEVRDNRPSPGFDGPSQPVVNVNWFEAAVYALLHGGMLPTEWQWEYAARAVQGREGLRDYATPSGRLTHEEAHFGADSTVDVYDPKYPTLENGLRHMTGNVSEWMMNWYGHYPLGEVIDPTEPLKPLEEREFSRSMRGGPRWFDGDRFDLRAAMRSHDRQEYRSDSVGFRVVAPPQGHQ